MKKIILAIFTIFSLVSFAETKSFQISLLPKIQLGANHTDDINGVSLNILGAENSNVTGLDVTFLGYRKVNGNFKGLHLGIFPEMFDVNGDMSGLSLATINNIKGNSTATLGFVNLVDGNSAFQFGFVNYVKEKSILQLGGVNWCEGTSNVQWGIFNYSNNARFLQLGIINGTKKLDGLQVGLINYAETNALLPVLPFVNFTKRF